jgi:hypothetical protein
MMKLKLMIAAAGAVAALVPVGALAHHGGTEPNPAHTCKAQQQAMGATAFKAAYGGGSNAFGVCVSRVAKQQQAAKTSASSACAAERAANPAAFATEYGSKGLGKCVSQSAKQKNDAQTRATVSAAKQCKALTAAQLAADYGSGKNAFGKCVSARAKAQNP